VKSLIDLPQIEPPGFAYGVVELLFESIAMRRSLPKHPK
jgi:hypothetical protein